MEYKEQQPPMTVYKQVANLRSLGVIIIEPESMCFQYGGVITRFGMMTNII